MDWKNLWTKSCHKAGEFWKAFLKFCGVAWDWSKKTWGKTKVWLRKVWNKTNIWLTRGWNFAKVVYAKVAAWLGKAWDYLRTYGKHLIGALAVLALKVRKWFLKKTPRLQSWWAKRFPAEKKEKIQEELPAPVEKAVEPEVPQVIEEEWEEEAEEVYTAPVRRTPAPGKLGKVGTVLAAIWKGFSTGCIWIYRARKFIMAAPVAFYAIKLAIANANRLPEMVGMDIQASGEFARMVSRQSAVMGPLGLTAFCLVLVLCSKKPLLPWLISAFTLILPILIWMTNYYA